MKKYIAYGSNIPTSQMKRRCPNSKFITTGYLEGYELEFRSVYGGDAFATIKPNEKSRVPIAIYEISDIDEMNLDYYEGVKGNHYYKKEVNVIVNNQVITGMVYIMNDDSKLGMPSGRYVSVVCEGYIEHDLDSKYLSNALVKSSVVLKS